MAIEESTVTEESKVFDSCYETHVYQNVNGEITIQQKCWPDEDVFISIPKEHIERMVSALRMAKRGIL